MVWFPKKLEAQGLNGTVQINGVGAWGVVKVIFEDGDMKERQEREKRGAE